jgi:hypothetical protein
MDVSTMFDSDSPYAKAAENTTMAEQTVIEAVGQDEYEDKPFVWIKVACLVKPIKLNKTCGRTLSIFGNDTDSWVGKPIFLATRDGQMGDGKPFTAWVTTPITKPAGGAPFDDAIPMT